MPHIPDLRRHETHDPLLIAAFAAGDATGPDLELATTLVAGCPECAALHHDLRAIAAALPALPAPVRRRDFRLTRADAARLRRTGWRAALAAFAGPRFRFAAPLGTSLAALGLAGLLLGAAAPDRPLGLFGATSGGTAAAPAPEPAPSVLGGAGGYASNSSGPAIDVAGSAAPSKAASSVPVAAPSAAASAPAPTQAPQLASGRPLESVAPDGPPERSVATREPAGTATPRASVAASDDKGAFVGRLDQGSGPGMAAGSGTGQAGDGVRAFVLAAAALMALAGITLVGLRLASRRLA